MEEQREALEVAQRNGDAIAGSFEARMQERRREREQRTTELFEPPGFEDLFRVELQALGYKRVSDIVMSHKRQRDESLQNLYINADIVLAATVGFYRVMPDEQLDEIDDGSWLAIARIPYPELDQTTRPRVALIRLLEGQGVATLANDWNEWNTRGNVDIDRDLRRDFSVTG